jgi:hypothetical protein
VGLGDLERPFDSLQQAATLSGIGLSCGSLRLCCGHHQVSSARNPRAPSSAQKRKPIFINFLARRHFTEGQDLPDLHGTTRPVSALAMSFVNPMNAQALENGLEQTPTLIPVLRSVAAGTPNRRAQRKV